MKKIIIVTGVSGIGKTTISSYLYNHYKESTLISMDQLKESIYPLIGYKSKQEKNQLKDIVYSLFSSILEECMNREDEIIIVEYPFSQKWKIVFENLIKKYSYRAITINVKTNDYEEVFDIVDKRNNSNQRNIIHSIDNYNPHKKSEYRSKNEINYNSWKEDYLSNKYTSINLGKVIDFYNIDDSYEELIKQIEKE